LKSELVTFKILKQYLKIALTEVAIAHSDKNFGSKTK